MAPRQDLVSSAVTFLRDPSVASSPVEKRIEFLQSKNLTSEEVDLALAQAGGEARPSAPPNHPYYPPQQSQIPPPGYAYPPQYGQWPQQPPPEPPRRDWRDYFIMATVVGGASYGLYMLAQRYIKPLIAPPTPPQLEQDKAAIDEQFNKAFALLETLSEDTTKLKDAEVERTKRLDSAIADIETIVADLKTANQRREDDGRRMEGEIKTMRDSLPRAIDSVKESSERQLKELSTELSSLKALMQNRTAAPASTYNIPRAPKPDAVSMPYSPSVRTPSVQTPTNESGPGSANNVTGVQGASTVPSFVVPNAASSTAATNATNPTASSAKPVSTNLGYGAGKVSIPAWQLAAQNKQEKEKSQTNGTPSDGADAVNALQAA